MTQKTEIVRARVSADLKLEAETVLLQLGMSMSDAIRIFLTQVSLRHEFPIELKIPNKTTLSAMAEPKTGKRYENANALFDEVLNSGDKDECNETV